VAVRGERCVVITAAHPEPEAVIVECNERDEYDGQRRRWNAPRALHIGFVDSKTVWDERRIVAIFITGEVPAVADDRQRNRPADTVQAPYDWHRVEFAVIGEIRGKAAAAQRQSCRGKTNCRVVRMRMLSGGIDRASRGSQFTPQRRKRRRRQNNLPEVPLHGLP
jgi:hypothetical protein